MLGDRVLKPGPEDPPARDAVFSKGEEVVGWTI